MLLIILLALLVVSAATSAQPGSVWMWSEAPVGATLHLTASHTAESAYQRALSQMGNFELAVVLTSADGTSVLDQPSVREAARAAGSKTVISHVYSGPTKSLSERFNEMKSQSSLDAAVQEIKQSQAVFHNNLLDVVHATYDHRSAASLEQLQSLAKGKKTVFVAYNGPQGVSQTPRRLSQSVQATSSNATVNPSNGQTIYYSPEGAEFSIYYADTYLYITPDIFTGLLTGIFFFFVGLLGLKCLGNIQGMSTFYDKLPSVGREA